MASATVVSPSSCMNSCGTFSLKFTARKLFGNFTVWNFARKVSRTSFHCPWLVKLRLGAHPMQCLLSNCTSRGSKVWQPGERVMRIE
jgi:hypothetical protein